MTSHDDRVVRSREKARRLKARALKVDDNLWRVRCGGTCQQHRGTKAGTFTWHFIRQKFQQLICDCDGAEWGNACWHVGCVERSLIRAAYRSLTPEQRAEFRKRMLGFDSRAA